MTSETEIQVVHVRIGRGTAQVDSNLYDKVVTTYKKIEDEMPNDRSKLTTVATMLDLQPAFVRAVVARQKNLEVQQQKRHE